MPASERIERLVAELARALERHADVDEAYLFGSAGRGEAGSLSDLDVAVRLGPGVRPERLRGIEIAADLMAALGRNEVEVVVLNGAPPLLYHRVLRDGRLILSRDPVATTRRAGEALSRYCDFVPQLAKIEASHRARISAGELGR